MYLIFFTCFLGIDLVLLASLCSQKTMPNLIEPIKIVDIFEIVCSRGGALLGGVPPWHTHEIVMIIFPLCNYRYYCTYIITLQGVLPSLKLTAKAPGN